MKNYNYLFLFILLITSNITYGQLDTRVIINEKEIKLMKAELEALEKNSEADNQLLLDIKQDALERKSEFLEVKQESKKNAEQVKDVTERVDGIVLNTGLNSEHLNRFWMVLAAMLVFFMQAGFKVFEVGLVRVEDRNSVGIKNLMDWIIVAICFYFIGFGLMFGESIY